MKYIQSFDSVNEANKGKVHRAAKKGSYPAVVVVVQDGKVIHQEPVSTPDVAPATFNVMQEKYPKALLHLEDNTGKRLFSEGKLNEEGAIDYFYDEMSSEGILVTIFDAVGDGKTVKGQFTKKKWADGVPVTKHLTRGGYKDIKTPKGKFQLIESPTFWYYEINNGWAAVNKKDYGTPPFEY